MKFIKRAISERWIQSQENVINNLRLLEEWQWLDTEQSLRLQQERLETILRFAYQHVPYYREVLEHAGAVRTSGQVNLNNFTKIPLLDKRTIRSNFEKLKSDDINERDWFANSSGGSTGEPITLVQDKEYDEWTRAVKLLHNQWTGYIPGSGEARLWGSRRDLLIGREKPKTHIKRWLKNELWLNAFLMTPEQMRSYIQLINRRKPDQLFGYVESLYDMARLIEREGLKVHKPRSIISSAGTLFPHTRETIERAFGAPVFNRYGSRELGNVACDCEKRGGLHINTPVTVVEVLSPDGGPAEPGEVGELVITVLTNFAMPLIRYRIGDMGIWSSDTCSCGRGWPILKEVTGRITEIFPRRDGTRVWGNFIITLYWDRDWVDKVQVIQEDYEHIRVLIARRYEDHHTPEYIEREMADANAKIRSAMGDNCRIDYEFMDEITPTESGKFRLSISKVHEQESDQERNYA